MSFLRSMLFAPASNIKIMAKALAAGADAVIFDLEDAVASNMKEEARRQIKNILNENMHSGTKVYIRINSWDGNWGKEDLIQLRELNIQGIMLPKAQDTEQLQEVSRELPSTMELIPLIETVKGVVNAKELAKIKKVLRLAFGALDYTLDIGVSLSYTGKELLYPRSCLVMASKLAEINPPVDTVFPDIQNHSGFEQDLQEAKIMGMFGKLLIHPSQIVPTHNVFSPSLQEIDYYQKVYLAFSEAESKGVAAVQVDGKMVDYPVFIRAKKMLDFAKQINQTN